MVQSIILTLIAAPIVLATFYGLFSMVAAFIAGPTDSVAVRVVLWILAGGVTAPLMWRMWKEQARLNRRTSRRTSRTSDTKE